MDDNFLAFLDDLDKEPNQLLREWQEAAERVKTLFLQENLHQRKKEYPDQFVDYLKEVFSATALFMDDAMLLKLKNIGLDWLVLQWMIPLEKILEELNRIELNGGVTLPRTNALVYIKGHIDASWLTDLQIAFDYTVPVNKNPFTTVIKSMFHRLYRNRNKQTGQFPAAKNEGEQKVIDMILALETHTGMPELLEKSLKQLSGGNTKKTFLKSIVDSDEVHPRTNQYYRNFFPLFVLINPHIHFMTEEEFSCQFGWESTGYLEYQARMVKNLIR